MADEADLSGSSHRFFDGFHHDRPLFRWIFIGNMPCGIFASRREIGPVCDLINFYNRTVNVIGKLIPHLTDAGDRLKHFFRTAA